MLIFAGIITLFILVIFPLIAFLIIRRIIKTIKYVKAFTSEILVPYLETQLDKVNADTDTDTTDDDGKKSSKEYVLNKEQIKVIKSGFYSKRNKPSMDAQTKSVIFQTGKIFGMAIGILLLTKAIVWAIDAVSIIYF